MDFTRRGFLGSMLAAAAAPYVMTDGIARGIIAPIRPLLTMLPAGQDVWTPEVLDISSYGSDYSIVVPSLTGEHLVAKRRMDQHIDIRFAGMLHRDLMDAFDKCEPVNLKMPGFQGTFMVTSIRGDTGDILSTNVGMVSVDRVPGVRVHELDLSHVMRGRMA